MANQEPTQIELAFPLKGVDRSLPARQQLPLTTYENLNVRAFPPSSDRLGGGSREGYSKLFADVAGTVDNLRIQGLNRLTEATNITDPNQFGSVALAEDWTTQATGDPTDLGVNWINLQRTATTTSLFPGYSISAANQLELDTGSTSSFNAVLSLFFIDQSVGVTAVIDGTRSIVGTGSQGYGATDECNNVGPMLGVDTLMTTGIFACFTATAADTVQCKIYEFDGVTMTEKATSGDLVLDGTGTASDYTIVLTRDGATVSCDFDATGVLVAGVDIDETLTYSTALVGNRGGVGMFPGGFQTNFRLVDSVSLTNLVPPSNTVFASVDPTVANPIDGNQFYLPSSFQGVDRTALGVLTITAGGPTSATDPEWPAIDDTNDTIIVGNPGGASANFPEKINFALYSDMTQRYGVTLRVDKTQWDAKEDVGCPVFRASSDGRNALIIQLNARDPSVSGIVELGDVGVGIQGIAIVDNVVTDLGNVTIGGSNQDLFWFHQDADYRVTDDGTTIRFYVNGILIYSFAPSSFPNWTPAIETALDAYIGTGFTGGHDEASAVEDTAEFGKVEIVQGEGSEVINVSNVKNKIAVYSVEKVQIGDTNDLTLVDVVGPVLINPLPCSMSFNRKFYAVDGNDEIIVDPATSTGSDWASAVTAGTLPVGPSVCAFFRGSAYVAATPADRSIWYKSRTLDPLDWDYGADPQVSSAVAGNNGSVGQPGDAITALIPYTDDYLVFGMARSLGVLEGDPGYGGQFQIVSNEAGIVGPRAFCFDDRGNLYFVGAGGLFRMIKGGFAPEPVGPRKLRRELEEIDINSHLIQLAYRPSDRTVRIYITPTDAATIGTHIVYDTRTDGFSFDQIPLGFGPWAIEQINGTLDIDRNLIIGCNDGFVRRPDDETFSDDGTAISSHVEILIPEAMKGVAETICQELQFVLSEGGDTITWRWFSGRSPEEVRLQTVGSELASGTVTGTGFKTPIGLRAAGAAHKLRLEASSSTAGWSIERVIAMMGITTNRRR